MFPPQHCIDVSDLTQAGRRRAEREIFSSAHAQTWGKPEIVLRPQEDNLSEGGLAFSTKREFLFAFYRKYCVFPLNFF